MPWERGRQHPCRRLPAVGPRVLAQGGQLRGGHLRRDLLHASAPWPGLPRSRGWQTHSPISISQVQRRLQAWRAARGRGCGERPRPPPPVRLPSQWDSWCCRTWALGRRWGCSRAWDRQGDPIALRAGPWGRQSQAGRPNSASGGGAGPRAFPVWGWGRFPGSPTLHRANSGTAGVPGAHTPQPRPLLGCGCAPLCRPSRNTRGAHCSPGGDVCAPRLGPPPSGPLRTGDGARARRPPLPSLRGLLRLQRAPSTRGGEGTGACSQTRCARPALSPAPPRLCCPGSGSRAHDGQPARERRAAAHSPPPS